jgi:hypothetical protein
MAIPLKAPRDNKPQMLADIKAPLMGLISLKQKIKTVLQHIVRGIKIQNVILR